MRLRGLVQVSRVGANDKLPAAELGSRLRVGEPPLRPLPPPPPDSRSPWNRPALGWSCRSGGLLGLCCGPWRREKSVETVQSIGWQLEMNCDGDQADDLTPI